MSLKNALALPLVLSSLLGVAPATQTTGQIVIGGPGALGRNGGNPPTLNDGTTVATGTIDYTYDDQTGILTLVVANTSPIVATPNPIISDIYLNLPAPAVAGAILLSQTPTNPTAQNFTLAVDTNPMPGGTITVPTFGNFGMQLTIGSGVAGAIANAAAPPSNIDAPPGSWVYGPVTFEILIQPAVPGQFTASSFARSFSKVSGTDRAINAAVQYVRGGAFGDFEGIIGNAPGCIPGGWFSGSPCLGNTVELSFSSAPGCFGCLFASMSAGPSGPYPIGAPAWPVFEGITPASNVVSQSYVIPNDARLIGMTAYFLVFMNDPMNPAAGFDTSDGFSVTICR